MVKEKKHTTSNKRKDIMNFIMTAVIIVLANFVFSFYFQRFDLTSEKRYTLSSSTRELLKKLDDVVYFKVYLDGDLNPDFTRLRNETKEILDEFRAYSNNQIEYEFINPAENLNKEDVEKIERQLFEKGILPEQIMDRSKKAQKVTQSRVWPGALVTYKGREVPLQLYKRQKGGGFTTEMSVNNSVQELEYGLTNSIRKLQSTRRPEITFIEGHGELDTLRQYDFMRSLGEYYEVNRTEIKGQLEALKGTDLIVISQPDSVFVEKDKFIIDQFIMNGGKVLWMIDPVYLNMDTFRIKQFTLGFSNDLGLEDMLFKYGVRLNPVLIQDINCSTIPVNVGYRPGEENWQPFPWLYSPVVMPEGDHPIIKNLDLIKLDFASTIDTIISRGIKKTILLHTSRYSKVQPTPARVALAMVQFKPRPEQFNQPYLPVACLLEGEFESNYAHRAKISMHDSILKAINFKDHGKATKMIVIADGDIARNELYRGAPMELGFDRYTKQLFANKTFLLNCVNYLLDDEGLLQIRAREVKLRLLDKKKIDKHETKWQMINIGLPLGLIILFGLIQFYIRKRKYSS
jgi:ABC-2 type transport system permease protein